MKKILVLPLLFISIVSSYSQVISGVVLDRQTHDTIAFASVYINGTFIGTNTDQHGRFTLDLAGRPFSPLTISAIGYYSITVNEFSPSVPLVVWLQPKVYEVEEVVINARSHAKQRREFLKTFKREFLGLSLSARSCEILNENDISFNYGAPRDTIIAYANGPIRIRNNALAYTITYYLDEFRFNPYSKDLFFMGNIIFKEDLIEMGNRQRIENRRKHAYRGSTMHFFRALWGNDLRADGFKVTDRKQILLQNQDLVTENDSIQKSLYYPKIIFVKHGIQLSSARFSKTVVFSSDGNYDPTGLSWSGEMATRRVGDWLPYEYAMKKNIK
jgi:hypothetical protein